MSPVEPVCTIKRAGSKGEPHILESLKWQDKNPGVQIGMGGGEVMRRGGGKRGGVTTRLISESFEKAFHPQPF